MGAPAQQPVYYDADEGQYYTINNKQRNQNFLSNLDNTNSQSEKGTTFGNMFGNLVAQSGMPNRDNPFYTAIYANRNYLNNPYAQQNAFDRFQTNAQVTPYAELTNLFPMLNTNLAQGLISSIQPEGAMYGAGRFLAPQTTNTQGK